MDFISEKKAGKRIKLLALLLGVLPQILRIALDFFNLYEVAGNHEYEPFVETLCTYGANILAQFSFFSVLGILIYLSARNGLNGGGDITLLIVGLYIVFYCIQSAISNESVTLAIFVISALMTALAVILSAKKNVTAYLIATLTLAISLLGGMIQLGSSGVPLTVDDIMLLISYAVANLVIELLILLVACRTSKFLNERMKGEISLTGKLISLKNPALLSMLIFDALYVIMSLVTPTITIIDNLTEYGPPVNSSEWMPIIGVYLEAVIVFMIGYASMRFAAGLVEGAYARAEEE